MKIYGIDVRHGGKITKAKGVARSVVKSYPVELYKDVLFNKKTHVSEMTKIRAYNHKVFTEKIQKISLNHFDDKRFTLKDNINTLAWGHYKIKSLDTPINNESARNN